MRRHLVFVVLAVLALSVAPSLAAAKQGHAAKCAAGKVKHGKSCAKRRAADSPASTPTAVPVPAAIVQGCKAEQTADPAAFVTTYGDAAGREALGRCIQGHLGSKTPTSDGPKSSTAPGQVCHAEQAADPAAFQKKYADANGHEPFGRCVSQHASAKDDEGDDDASEDDSSGDDAEDTPAPKPEHTTPAPTVTASPAVLAALTRCRAALAADSVSFLAQYADASGHEALGRCVKAQLAAPTV